MLLITTFIKLTLELNGLLAEFQINSGLENNIKISQDHWLVLKPQKSATNSFGKNHKLINECLVLKIDSIKFLRISEKCTNY